jgi:hypothetical protein
MDLEKTVKIYSEEKLNESVLKDLKYIFKKYNKSKNNNTHQLSSINSYLKIYNFKKEIRDPWTKQGKLDKFNIPKRYVRNSIDDCIGNIKTNWLETKKQTKEWIKNSKLNDDQKHYMYYILKSKDLLFNVLNEIPFNTPKKFIDKNLNIKWLNKKISSRIRKFLPKKPKYKKDNSIMLDQEMYAIKDNVFYLTGLIKNKRYKIKLMENSFKIKGNIRIKVINDKLCIHLTLKTKTHRNNYTNEIGIDKNYLNTFDTSTEKSYGKNFNVLQNVYTDNIDIINKRRQYYIQKIKNLEEISELNPNLKKKNQRKIDNIKKFNLGKKKYNRTKNKYQENIRKHINNAINDLFENEKPKLIHAEDLTFQAKDKGDRNKASKNKLCRFAKGVIKERLDYKAKHNNIEINPVNAAYSSQECSNCDYPLGSRKDDIFYCPSCGKVEYSGANSGKVVFKRGKYGYIPLNAKPYIVLNILKKRLVDKDKKSS